MIRLLLLTAALAGTGLTATAQDVPDWAAPIDSPTRNDPDDPPPPPIRPPPVPVDAGLGLLALAGLGLAARRLRAAE